jgi:hypothetical protein
MNPSFRTRLRLGVSAITMIAAWNAAIAQEPNAPPPVSPGNAPATQTQPSTAPNATPPSDATPIPQITVTAPKEAPSAPAKPATTTQRPTCPAVLVRTAPAPAAPARTAPVQTAVPAQTAAQIAAAREAAATRAFTQQVEKANQVRENIVPRTGTDVTQVSHQDISNAPGGANQSVGDLLVNQFPGVSQDSTSSGDYHVRNDHANVQFRVNGILLPDGVSGFAQFMETSFIGSMALITGALPAQYGLHNTAIVDITSKDFRTNPNSGSIGVYGGTYATVTPTFEYGGKVGQTEYFFAGREFSNNLGLENPTGSATIAHDWDTRGGFFGYTSTYLDESTRISSITGAQTIKYQIPINPGQQVFPGLFPIYGAPATGGDSAKINEVQYEKSAYAVLAYQKSLGDLDMQAAWFTRYNSLQFVPGGGHVGCNYQWVPSLVIGMEADFSGTSLNAHGNAESTFAGVGAPGGGINWSTKLDSIATVRGRLGYAWMPNTLLYITAGGAFGRTSLSSTDIFISGCPACATTSFSNASSGVVLGGGVEWAPWSNNWTIRAEYLWYSLGGASGTGFVSGITAPATSVTWSSLNMSSGRAGLSYKF